MTLFGHLTAKTVGLVLALVLASATTASAAVTLRTAPFPGPELSSGFARCLVRNGGATSAEVKLTLL